MNITTPREGQRRITSGRLGLVCGILALTVSLGAPSEAAKLINGRLLKNNSVAGEKLMPSTITGTKVKKNTLTGSDIKESSLGTVPRASEAANIYGVTVNYDGVVQKRTDPGVRVALGPGGQGDYRVSFARNVSACVLMSSTNFYAYTTDAFYQQGDPKNLIRLRAVSYNGTITATPASLVVICP